MIPACPNCGAPLREPPVCSACGIVLTGPLAQRLWDLDRRLGALEVERNALLKDRPALLAALLADDAAAAAPAAGGHGVGGATAASGEARPIQVQSTLLGLGALLLGVAGVVFAAVSYRTLGVAGQALVLLALTALAGTAPVRLRARALTASAEAVGAVAVVLAVTDAGLLRRAGLAADVDSSTYWAAATAVLAAAAGGYHARVPLRSARTATVLLAQLPALLVAVRLGVSASGFALVMTAVAGADLLAAADLSRGSTRAGGRAAVGRTAVSSPGSRAGRRPAVVGTRSSRGGGRVAAGCAALLLLASTALGSSALLRGYHLGALALLAVAVVLGTESAARSGRVRVLLSALPVLLVAVAAYGLVRPGLASPQRPLVLVAVALLALQVAGLVPPPRRPGPAVGALAVALAALAGQGDAVQQAVLAPFGWTTQPWSAGGGGARALVGPGTSWSGTVVCLAVLIGAAVAVLGAGLVLDRLRAAAAAAGVLLVLAGLILPVGVGASYPVALGLLAGSAGAAVAGSWWPGGRSLGLPYLAVPAGALVAAWSLADRQATLIVLPLLAGLAAVTAVRVRAAAAVAALLVGASVAALAAACGLVVEQVGACLLPVAGATLLLSLARRRVPLEVSAGMLGLVGTGLATGDPGWLSWTLAADGLLALALALRPDRRQVATAGALLLTASGWVRLAAADVRSPEPYVLPLAALALLLGHLRRRRQPSTGSFAAYGPGLSLLLVPSLLASLGDVAPLRAVLLLPAAALVVIVGASERLRAPLAIGGVVVALDGLHLLAPYAAALPRWSLLALVGTVLVVLGATYEQRRQELARARERFADLG